MEISRVDSVGSLIIRKFSEEKEELYYPIDICVCFVRLRYTFIFIRVSSSPIRIYTGS